MQGQKVEEAGKLLRRQKGWSRERLLVPMLQRSWREFCWRKLKGCIHTILFGAPRGVRPNPLRAYTTLASCVMGRKGCPSRRDMRGTFTVPVLCPGSTAAKQRRFLQENSLCLSGGIKPGKKITLRLTIISGLLSCWPDLFFFFPFVDLPNPFKGMQQNTDIKNDVLSSGQDCCHLNRPSEQRSK